jgi:hypothetical protein
MGHGVARIDGEIQDDLLDLSRIHVHVIERCRQVR